MYDDWFSINGSFLEKEELGSKINNCLKSHKELGELIDYQYPFLDEADKEKLAIEPYPKAILCSLRSKFLYKITIQCQTLKLLIFNSLSQDIVLWKE